MNDYQKGALSALGWVKGLLHSEPNEGDEIEAKINEKINAILLDVGNSFEIKTKVT